MVVPKLFPTGTTLNRLDDLPTLVGLFALKQYGSEVKQSRLLSVDNGGYILRVRSVSFLTTEANAQHFIQPQYCCPLCPQLSPHSFSVK